MKKKKKNRALIPLLGVPKESFRVGRRFLSINRIESKKEERWGEKGIFFREHHSTTTRFVQFLQHISTGLLQQTASLVIYIDFTKAFDQLWHDGLLYKLHRMNCPHELVNFIIEYLKNRKCCIKTQKTHV